MKVEYADKASEVAKAELRRSHESIEQFAKSISQSQLDVERLTVEKLALERKGAEHELSLLAFDARLKESELRAAELALDQHHVRAPFAGHVVLVRGRLGEWIQEGTPVLRLVATDTLRAEGFLDAEQASAGLLNREVDFIPSRFIGPFDDKDVVLSGRLVFVSPEVDPVTNQVRVWAELDNAAGKLRPGEQGTLKLRPADTTNTEGQGG